jgi:elongation factor G
MGKEYSTENIRNVAIIGHSGTGKTTLNEMLLYFMDSISHPGSIASKNTVSDTDEEEKERLISIHSSVNFGEYKGTKINIIDCPGMSDFVGQVRSALRVSESAIILVDSVDGIQMETEKNWKYVEEYNIPRIVFVNKMDKENSKFYEVLDQVSEKFKKPVIPIDIPLGSGPSFRGVIDLVDMKAYIPEEGASKKVKETEIPSDMLETAQEYREKLMEVISETDDELTLKFLEGEKLTSEEIKEGLSKGIIDGKAILASCGSGDKHIGIGRLLELISQEFPSPALKKQAVGHLPGKAGQEVVKKVNNGESVSAFVFKTKIDQYSGRLNYIKVVSGCFKGDSDLLVTSSNAKIKPGHLYQMKAGKLVETDHLCAGDIGVVSKIDEITVGDTICDPKNPVEYHTLRMPQPVYSLAITAKEKKDEDKMNELLHRAAEEDPTFHVVYNSETKQNVISGMGELQISIILDDLDKRYKIKTETVIPRIAYRETVAKPSKADYRHKKQSGGHGQFGEVWIELDPIKSDKLGLKGLEFVDKIVGGAIPKQFIPAVEKGIIEGMDEGVLGKYPVTDIKVTLFDGKFHNVDSNELSFKLAARGALKKALESATPVLLEPVMDVEIHVDKDLMGNILSDVTSRRGRVLGMESENGDVSSQTQVIKAFIPQAETQKYIVDLRSMTGGKATFEMKFSHYEKITGRDADLVLQSRAKELEEEH